jgi:hypothetical protein
MVSFKKWEHTNIFLDKENRSSQNRLTLGSPSPRTLTITPLVEPRLPSHTIMKKKNRYAVLIAAAFILGCLPGRNLSGQTGADDLRLADESFQLVLDYQGVNEARYSSNQGVVEPVSVHLNEDLPLTIEVPRDKAGTPVMVGTLDGGEIIVRGALSVAEDGTSAFTFHAGSIPGLYRLLVTAATGQYLLRVYVVDPNRVH